VLDQGVPHYEDGEFVGYIGSCIDITDRNRSELALRKLSGRLMQAQDDERKKIAREMHDSVGQLATALQLNISRIAREKEFLSSVAAGSIEEAAVLIKQLAKEIRTLSHLLHPPMLEELGLVPILKDYVARFAERSGMGVNLDISSDFVRPAPNTELCLYRIVQESLLNVHRHSESSTVSLLLYCSDREIKLEVRDAGKSIPREKLLRIRSGIDSGVGLSGMRERVRQLGGAFDIESDTSGTRILVALPLIDAAEPTASTFRHQSHLARQASH